MNKSDFIREGQRVLWIATKSPAALSVDTYTRGGHHFWWSGIWSRFAHLLELRGKDWARMAKGKRTGFVQNIKFVDLELTRDGKDAFKAWDFTQEELVAYVETRGSEGYKLGVSWKPDRGAWVASLTCVDTKSGNFEYCLSAYGRDWLQAIAVLAYKDVVLLAGDWAKGDKPEADSDNFG